MSISTQTPRTYYTGDGTTTDFSTVFVFFKSTDIKVYLTDTVTLVTTLQVKDTDYTLAGGAGNGSIALAGTVSFTTAPGTTKQVSIILDPAQTQDANFSDNDPFPAATLNAQLDKILLLIQKLENRANRSLALAEVETTATLGDMPSKASRASVYLAFDSNGNPIASLGTPGTVPVSVFMQGVVDAADAATARSLLATPTAIETLTNKTLDDSTTLVANTASPTKKAKFDASAITAGQTRSFTFPDFSDTLVGLTGLQSISNKILSGLRVTAISAAKTAGYTGLTTDVYLPFDASGGALALTLPVGVAGQMFVVHKTDSSFNAVTIQDNSSVAQTTLNTQDEKVWIMHNGAAWVVVHRHIPRVWTAYTPTGSWNTNTTYTGKWRRIGGHMEVQFKLALAGAPNASILTVNIPSGPTIDTAQLLTSDNSMPLGRGGSIHGSTVGVHQLWYNTTTSVLVTYLSSVTTAAASSVSASAPVVWATGDTITGWASFPIANWNG